MNPKPPKQLSAEAKKLWTKILDEYEISDIAGLSVLRTALEAFDSMRAAQKKIKDTGLLITDRWNQEKINPACAVERDSRAQFLQTLKMLNLDFFEPVRDSVGRPGGK